MRVQRGSAVDDFLENLACQWSWTGLSALDRYYRGATRATSFGSAPEYLPHESVSLASDLAELASLEAELEFPGIDGIDAIIRNPAWDRDLYVILADGDADLREKASSFYGSATALGDLLRSRRQQDRFVLEPGIYRRIRHRDFLAEIEDGASYSGGGDASSRLSAALIDAALLARYRIGPYARAAASAVNDAFACAFEVEFTGNLTSLLPRDQWRYWIDSILTGPRADLGLDYLACRGVLAAAFPELGAMNRTDQHKDHHPEGNVWRHTLETLKYRKSADLRLAYALLLHDAGKPQARPSGGRRFDRHAQIGARLAGVLLRDLGHRGSFVGDVMWLVENHGYPSALSRLPRHIADPLMADHRFPLLLELYRCDISASYSGPENYYAACDVYNRYRKDAGLKRYRPVH
jgi:hypothetical protein